MVYALKGTVGGAVENVWGHDMQVLRIDSSDKTATDAAKVNGYTDKPQDIIDVIEAKAMQKENDKMKGQLSDGKDKARIDELEGQLATALNEVASLEETVTELKDKVEVYESAKDKNGNGKVDYEEMTNKELQALLDQRKVEYGKRDGKDALIKLANDSEW